MDLIDDAGRGQVEDSGAASESAENGGVVEELDLEETEMRLCSFTSTSASLVPLGLPLTRECRSGCFSESISMCDMNPSGLICSSSDAGGGAPP
ncbi:hypothetical protein FCV25MIE_19571, partial [Fagus crenata]